MSAFCLHTPSKTLVTLVTCIVNDALLQAKPNVQQTLLQCAVQLRLMHSLLDVTTHQIIVIDRIKVGGYKVATDLED